MSNSNVEATPTISAKGSTAKMNRDEELLTMNPTALKSKSPSPEEIFSDLIDATSHEILLLEGRRGEDKVAPWPSFLSLVKRLNFYVYGFSDVNTLELKQGTKNRLALAKLAIEVCSGDVRCERGRSTDDEEEEEGGEVPKPLVDFSAEKWKELIRVIESLRIRLKYQTRDEESAVVSPGKSAVESLFKSLKCQMESMQALAYLKESLEKFATGEESQRDKDGLIPSFANITSDVHEYFDNGAQIQEDVRNDHLDCSSQFFLPEAMFSSITYLDSQDEAAGKKLVEPILRDVDDFVSNQICPLLETFQCKFFKLLKQWERIYLTTPTLFDVNYFQYSESVTSKAKGILSTPVSPSVATTAAGKACRTHRSREAVVETRNKEKERRRNNIQRHRQVIEEIGSDDDLLPIVTKQSHAQGRPLIMPIVKTQYRRIGEKLQVPLKTENSPSSSKTKSHTARTRHKRKKTDRSKNSPAFETPKPPRKRSSASRSRYELHFSDSKYNETSEPPQVRRKLSRSPGSMASWRQYRIRYSDEEKRCLLEGVKKYGVGKWVEILNDDEYKDVFAKNDRTNVNLKDLYRNLTKVKPQDKK
ncbi:hypothetical protein ACHAXS_004669 [Conticribra weissflogii]